MRGGDDYVTVTAVFLHASEKAVKLKVDPEDGAPAYDAWVPRSCLHAADDRTIDNVAKWSEVTLQVRRWKAEELGLI